MVDREDIDALLIGRLYGELSSADEARLQAHLGGAGPKALADRRALEDLTQARSVVRESRLLAQPADPPQSISALLMQEAARRAPKVTAGDAGDGWFARFVRSFMQHPAMAAAATLVLVVGVAGALYSRQGDHFAEQHRDSSAARSQAAAPATEALSLEDDSKAGSSAAPADPAAAPAALEQTALQGGGEGEGKGKRMGDTAGLVDGLAGRTGVSVGLNEGPAKNRQVQGIEVTTPQAQPKDFDRADDEVVAKKPGRIAKPTPTREEAQVETSLGIGGAAAERSRDVDDDLARAPEPTTKPDNAAADQSATTKESKPVPDARRYAPAPKAKAETPGSPAPVSPASPPPPAAVEDKQASWAKTTHDRVVTQAKAKRCDEAATTADSIAQRDRAYYDANVRNDRDLKGCMTRIAQKREQTEATQRAKAGKKSRTEPAKATTTAPASSDSK